VPVPPPVTTSHANPSAIRQSDRLPSLAHGAAVLGGAVVRLQSAQPEALVQLDLAREVDHRCRVGHAGAAVSDVEFDVDVQLGSECTAGRGKLPHLLGVVDAHADRRLRMAHGQRRQRGDLALADDLVGHQHVVDAAREEDLRLGNLLAADADGSCGHLPARNLDTLVALGVRADAHAAHR
jgi:hypothetical protein